MPHTVALLGLPTDRNSSHLRGPAGAPPLVRAALWNEGANPYAESGVNLRGKGVLHDAGDVALREDDGDFARIESAIADALVRDMRPLSIGGDHFVTYPVVAAMAKRYPDLAIVHFDAHPDMYPEFGGNRWSHACPFARILQDVGVRALVQIGIRTMTPPQRAIAEEFDVRVFSPYQLEEARAALPAGPVYVSLDLDGLDPAFAPGVSHREPGGLSVRDVLSIVRAIPGEIVGADVVELNPACDVDSMTATVAAKFVKEFAARMHGAVSP